MKNFSILIAAAAGLFILTAAISFPSQKPGSVPPSGIPDSVYAVFEKSCLDCHADNGNGLAKAKVNFPKWDGYDAAKQGIKARAVCQELEAKTMPPEKFLRNNPAATPTAAEIARICRWADKAGK